MPDCRRQEDICNKQPTVPVELQHVVASDNVARLRVFTICLQGFRSRSRFFRFRVASLRFSEEVAVQMES